VIKNLGLGFFFCSLLAGPASASVLNPSQTRQKSVLRAEPHKPGSQSKWNLRKKMELLATSPKKGVLLARRELRPSLVRRYAFEQNRALHWRIRYEWILALTTIFDPSHSALSPKDRLSLQRKVKEIFESSLLGDPSLLVRDAVVEGIRRVGRMQPGLSFWWKPALERAFVDPNNVLQGEGFFIRETILAAFDELNLRPSPKLLRVALADKNSGVRVAVARWDRRGYDLTR
jgi:hypothetical protein